MDCGPVGQWAPLSLARVDGASRAYFHVADVEGCPADSAACRTDSHVVAGDIVAVGERAGGFICAAYPARTGAATGWMLRGQLVLLSAAKPALGDWAGAWTENEGPRRRSIRITPGTDGLAIEATANWTGDESGGAIDDWAIRELVSPKGDHVVLSGRSACPIEMKLLDPYLIVMDAGACRGPETRLTGVYRTGGTGSP